MRRGVLVAMSALLLGLACGGSGGGGGGGSSQPAGSTKVTMTDFKFDPSDLKVKSGKVSFFLVNNGGVSHDLVVTSSDGKSVARSELVQPGNSTVLTVDNLAAGDYKFICDQPGHADQGMKGTLTAS
ncbi:MAG TPA: cupredoxin domain-containing protein [Candidatus Dormibacteraeota bacterium]